MNSDATAGIVEMNERENVTKAEERNDKRIGSTRQVRTRFAKLCIHTIRLPANFNASNLRARE